MIRFALDPSNFWYWNAFNFNPLYHLTLIKALCFEAEDCNDLGRTGYRHVNLLSVSGSSCCFLSKPQSSNLWGGGDQVQKKESKPYLKKSSSSYTISENLFPSRTTANLR